MQWYVLCDKHEKTQNGSWYCETQIDPIFDLRQIKEPIDADTSDEAVFYVKENMMELLGLNAIGSKLSGEVLQVFFDYSNYEAGSPDQYYDRFIAVLAEEALT